VANALVFLNPRNFTYYDVPFASSVFLELHYDMECVQEKRDRKCFWVMAWYNNQLLQLEGCNKEGSTRTDRCLVDDFLEYYDQIRYKGDIDKACMQKFVPP